MEQEVIDDTWFVPTEVTQKELKLFRKKLSEPLKKKLSIFFLTMNEAAFVVDVENKIFRVLDRMEYSGITFQEKVTSQAEINYAVCFVLKLATIEGYKICLEKKYSN